MKKVTIRDDEYNNLVERHKSGNREDTLDRSLYKTCENATGTHWQGNDFDLRVIDRAKTVETGTVHESARFRLTAEENHRSKR